MYGKRRDLRVLMLRDMVAHIFDGEIPPMNFSGNLSGNVSPVCSVVVDTQIFLCRREPKHGKSQGLQLLLKRPAGTRGSGVPSPLRRTIYRICARVIILVHILCCCVDVELL